MYDCIWDWTAYTSIGERFSSVLFFVLLYSPYVFASLPFDGRMPQYPFAHMSMLHCSKS